MKRFLPEETLGTAHGRLFRQGGLALFPTYHPAAMIYNRALEEVTRKDFQELATILEGIRRNP
jgi:uracil-DNA glycosylase